MEVWLSKQGLRERNYDPERVKKTRSEEDRPLTVVLILLTINRIYLN